MTQFTDHDIIEAYLNGTMSPSEKERFEIALAEDADLAAVVESHRKAAILLKYGAYKDMKKRLQKLDAREGIQGSGSGRQRALFFRRIAAAAAIFFIFASILWIWADQSFDQRNMAVSFYAKTEADSWRSMENDPASAVNPLELMAQAQEAFLAEKYAEAEIMLTSMDNPLFKEKQEWNLLLCYFMQEAKKAEFAALLNKIKSEEGHDFRDDALELEKSINNPVYRLTN